MSNVNETNRPMVKPISSHGDELEVDCGKLQNWTEITVIMWMVKSLHVFNYWWI